MTIERLMELVPPPITPLHAGAVKNWEAVERELGTEIPTDYKIIIGKYGSGAFDGYLWLLNPFEPNQHLNLRNHGAYLRESFAELRSQSPNIYGSPIFPERGGLLPWATTDEPDMIGWIVDGRSQNWAVGVHNTAENKIIDFGCNTTEFLVRLLSKELTGLWFVPDDFPQTPSSFIQL